MMRGHPVADVIEAGGDTGRDIYGRGGEREVELCVICIRVIGEPVGGNDVAKRLHIEKKEERT